MTKTTWAQTKHLAIQAFDGELPIATTEQTIMDAFKAEPEAVLRELHAVTDSHKTGGPNKPRSCWGVWKSRVETALTPNNVTVIYGDDRAKKAKTAETWIRNSGGYLDREEELHAELFAEGRPLHPWPDLKPRMLALWQEQRPRFITAETTALQYQTRLPDPEAQRLAYLDTITPDPQEEDQ